MSTARLTGEAMQEHWLKPPFDLVWFTAGTGGQSDLDVPWVPEPSREVVLHEGGFVLSRFSNLIWELGVPVLGQARPSTADAKVESSAMTSRRAPCLSAASRSI